MDYAGRNEAYRAISQKIAVLPESVLGWLASPTTPGSKAIWLRAGQPSGWVINAISETRGRPTYDAQSSTSFAFFGPNSVEWFEILLEVAFIDIGPFSPEREGSRNIRSRLHRNLTDQIGMAW